VESPEDPILTLWEVTGEIGPTAGNSTNCSARPLSLLKHQSSSMKSATATQNIMDSIARRAMDEIDRHTTAEPTPRSNP